MRKMSRFLSIVGLLAAVAAAVHTGIARNSQTMTTRVVAGCACPTMIDPASGALARIYAGGPPGADNLIIEDASTQDAYRYTVSGWKRIGASARTYAVRSNIYRLSGDAFAEIAVDNDDHWSRFGTARVGSEIFASVDKLYMVRSGTDTVATTLYRWDGRVPVVVDTVAAGTAPHYAANDSGIYKASGGSTFRYTGTPNSWSAIGSFPASALFPAAGTVFVRSGTNTFRYLGTPGQFASLGAGLLQIAGTTTAAYAIETGGNVVRLDPNSVRTTVRNIGDAHNIVAGGAHLFVLTDSGSILRLEDDGAWTDLTCAGGPSPTGCADGYEPGPVPTRVAPLYADSAAQEQSAEGNVHHDVLTQHNDLARTGAATYEDILTPAAVQSGSFGYLGSVPVSGRIYAQPLYVEHAAVACTGQSVTNANIAYVATLENRVYAIDIDTQEVCWSTPALGTPQKPWATDVVAGCGNRNEDGACNGNFNMNSLDHHDGSGEPHSPGESGIRIGIASTPVIDLARNVMYVVARHRDGSDARGRFFVHVIDIRTGDLVAKVEPIADTLNGRDDCNGKAFHASLSTQRAGLLLVNDRLFIAFSSNAGEDSTADYHGHVLALDVSNPANPVNVRRSFCATPNLTIFPDGRQDEARGGGIWMAGAAPAADDTSAYFTTGNGAYEVVNGSYVPSKIPEEPSAGNWPSSFVKLDLSMTASTGYNDHRYLSEIYPTPLPTYVPHLRENSIDHTIFYGRERSDADFGAGGVLLLGKSLIGGGKDGRLYVINTKSMTRVQDFQAFVHLYDAGTPQKTYEFMTRWYDGPHLHGSPVAWDMQPDTPWIYVYAWAEKDRLKRFRFKAAEGKFEEADVVDATPVAPFPTAHGDIGSSAPSAMPGGMLSLSSNGRTGGIVWATVQESYKFCSKVDPGDGEGWRVLVDQPLSANNRIPGCNIMGGYVPGRLFAFSADVDTTTPGGKRLKLLWGDTSASGSPIPAFPGTSTPPNNFIPAYAKHASPTIAHGKVLIATANGELRIYGLGASEENGPKHRVPAELRRDDIALTGLSSGLGIDLAASNGDGSFTASAFVDATWSTWAATANVARLAGDFNNDGRTDIALIGGAGWTQAKVAFSNTGGTFNVLQGPAPSFMGWATSTAARRLVGDFNGDGRSDLALVGDPGWHTIPVAASNGNGSFSVSNAEAAEFAFWGSTNESTKGVGDFDGDGKSDIALIGNPNWHTIPIAYSRTGSTFQVTNGEAGVFASEWAPVATERVVGDFNGDGRDDIALVGNVTWHTIPAAFADSVGSFQIENDAVHGVGAFARWAALPGVTRLVGDFNGDGRADIALVNVPTSESESNALPVAFSNGDGTFHITTTAFADGGFRGWAGTANVQPIVGDFNRDGYADVALTGGAGWVTIPCAVSKGDGTFVVFNTTSNLASFAARSAQAGLDRTRRMPGNYR
jgi:hypothetical protein